MCLCRCEHSAYNPKNDNQFSFVFPVSDHSKAYQDGYQTGIDWDASWWPGGPWAGSVDDRHSEEVKRKALALQEARNEWLTGFRRGLEERLKVNSHFAAWWNDDSKPKLARYIVPEECPWLI